MHSLTTNKFYIPGLSYYKQHGYVSNSDFSEVKRLLNVTPGLEGNFLTFGNLFDALITEPELIDLDKKLIYCSDGQPVPFTDQDLRKAQKMKAAAYAHPFVNSLLRNMEFQAEIYIDEFLIQSDIAEFYLPVRCKLDGLNKGINMAMDLKTTACLNLDSFIKSILQFDYDRQGAFYMDLAGVDRFVFVGISKVENRRGQHEIFIYAIERGDALYIQGREKYLRLAYYYDMLIIR